MHNLSQRQSDRIIRKAENALADGDKFDASRAGIGKIDKRYLKAEREGIDAATNAKIAEVAAALGMDAPREPG